MKLTLGFSPCPNDTFIFDAIVHHRIDLEGLDFEIVMKDVEELNRMAFAKKLDVTKLSFHAAAHLSEDYQILNSGSALGKNCGPLLIAKRAMAKNEIEKATVAIPGKYTTANFLFNLAFPENSEKKEMLFSEIESAVVNEEVEAGLIIHENRFTYAEKGLVKILDLGEFWENLTNLPIPLGAIAIQKSLPADIQSKMDRILQRSVQVAFDYPAISMPFVRCHAQEMDEAVMRQHIELYVNEFTLDLGETGRKAIERFFDEARNKQIVSNLSRNIFLN